MIQDVINQLHDLDRQLPNGPWTIGEVSASQADIMDADGNWIGTVRRDFDDDDENDKPLVIQLRNILPTLISSFIALRSEIVKGREEASQQRARAEAAEEKMAQKRGWQFTSSAPPTPGRWRMKFLRGTGYEIMEVEVTQFQTKSSNLIVIMPGQWANNSLPLDDEFFAHAQWQRIEESAD